MVVFPNAKINLGLNIIKKRSDGFHELESIFYPVPWVDALEIIPSHVVGFSTSGIQVDGALHDNLCMKVYEAMRERFDLPPVQIHLHKNIPIGAGLGGGSSDAAFTVKLLHEIFELSLTEVEMENFIRPFGSDCPFFIKNRPLLALGRGDVFEAADVQLKGAWIVLVYPDLFISTKEAYGQVRPQIPANNIRKVNGKGMEAWRGVLKNDFEEALFPSHPVLKALKEKMYMLGASYASMSGSGSTVFGIFDKEPSIDAAFPANYKVWKGVFEV